MFIIIRNFRVNFFSTCIFLYLLKIYINNYSVFEFYCKNNQNENFFEFFIFFWTNQWVALIFLFLLWKIFISDKNLADNLAFQIPTALLVYAYSIEVCAFFSDNLRCILLNSMFHNQNLLLINSLNEIHPVFLYLSAILFLQKIIRKWKIQFSNRIFYKIYFYRNSKNISELLMFFIITAVFLGGWWAEQEQSWNGWWNWDASETLSLGILFYFVCLVHSKFKICEVVKQKFKNFSFLYLNILLFLLVQLNFDQTNHNFGLKFFFFFDNFYFLNFILFTFTILFYFKIKNITIFFNFIFKIFNQNLSFYKNVKHVYYTNTIIIFFLIKMFVVSFLFNFNTNLWLTWALNALNDVNYFYIESFAIGLLLVIYFLNPAAPSLIVISNQNFIHFFILNFIVNINIDALYSWNELTYFKGKQVTSLNEFFQIINKNYEVEANLLKNRINLNWQNYYAFVEQSQYFFHFFEINRLNTITLYSIFTNFFYKNGKLEIFEISGSSLFFFNWFFFFFLMCFTCLKPYRIRLKFVNLKIT